MGGLFLFWALMGMTLEGEALDPSASPQNDDHVTEALLRLSIDVFEPFALLRFFSLNKLSIIV